MPVFYNVFLSKFLQLNELLNPAIWPLSFYFDAINDIYKIFALKFHQPFFFGSSKHKVLIREQLSIFKLI